MSMAVILLGVFIVVAIVAIIIPIIVVSKRKKERDKTNMDLFNDINENNKK